jgi:hypothetical protein
MASARDQRLQCLSRPFRGMLLREADDGVQQHDPQNADRQHEVGRTSGGSEGIGHEGDPGGDHQHDSEHVGELRPELGQHRPPARRRQLVGTDLRPPRRRLIRRKPPARAPEPGQHLLSLQRRHRRRRHQMLWHLNRR